MKRHLFALILVAACVVQVAAQTTALRAGYRAGVQIAFGTDAILDLPQYTRGTQALTWLDSYVAAGLTPADIIKAMTTTPARLLGVEATRGAIRPGMLADIIATPTTL